MTSFEGKIEKGIPNNLNESSNKNKWASDTTSIIGQMMMILQYIDHVHR